MGRTIPSALVTELASEANASIELYELYLEAQTYYYANAEQDITFGSQTYTALGIKRGKVGTHMTSKVDEINVSFDNTDRAFSTLFLAGDFQGRQLIIKKVLRGYLSDGDYYITMFDGKVDGVNVSSQLVSVRVVSWLDAVTKLYPGRSFQRQCNYRLGDIACTIYMTAEANKQTGIATNGSTSTTIQTTDLSESDDHWNNGYIKVTAGTNAGFSRPVYTFAAGATASIVLRLPFPEACDNTSQFEIYRGCAKTESDCNDKFDNIINYGGYPTIPIKPLF